MKKIKTIIKLQITAKEATPAPPVGPALGQHGLNIMDFTQKFNEQTREMEGIVPVEITVYEDRTFDFRLKKPPVSYLLKKAAGLEKGAAQPLRERVATLNKEQIRKIAIEKMEDFNTDDVAQAEKIVAGTARSMGIIVE